MPYITPHDVAMRYNNVSRVDSADIASHHIYYAEARLDSALSKGFTTPFSSNNITAKDLSIDLTYLNMGFLKDKDHKRLEDKLMMQIECLLNGKMCMLTTSGDTLQASGVAGSGYTYSTTEDFSPVFGRDEYEYSDPSSAEIQDEINGRT